MRVRHARRKEEAQRDAAARVKELFAQAFAAAKDDPAGARSLVHKARRAARHVRFKLPVALKRRFCRSCESVWVLGESARVRYRDGVKVIFCLRCKKHTRVPYRRKTA